MHHNKPQPAPLSTSIFSHLLQDFELPQNAPLAIAVSGGCDSMCLLRLLSDWCKANHHPLVALTVDHGIRPEAKDEANQVQSWCQLLDVKHYTLTWKGTIPTSNIQAKARKIRYKLLEEFCKNHHILHLFLAHHKQDQAETVMLRLMRGASVSGMAAMRKQSTYNNILLLRPLLTISSEQICATIKLYQQDFIQDPSNQDPRYLRVETRQFLDQLQRKEEIVTHINRTAKHMQRVNAFLNQEVTYTKEKYVNFHPFGFAIIQKDFFSNTHEEIALRTLSQTLMSVSGASKTVRFEELERLYHSLRLQETSALTLGGCIIRQRKNKFLILRETAALAKATAVRPNMIFDGRFFCEWPSYREHSTYLIGPLKAKGWHSICEHVKTDKLPNEVFYALPALQTLEKVIAVPHIAYVACERVKDFSAQFLNT